MLHPSYSFSTSGDPEMKISATIFKRCGVEVALEGKNNTSRKCIECMYV